MKRRIVALALAAVAIFGLLAGPAAAEEIFDCEGNIALACPGPVPW